ncbi:single-stranded DNA-binding protein [Alkalihalobacillus alcalophilus ATCC 27647 = CGMCC 1.3604]|uniref:Single-stranded DNA-binding protein n=1 Tax=Alkalihalobacillus alcalophilus ATCC 27647 = CGMCC 1.3604 TaxID=1218173 RepID=A0A094WDC8_ALKAL|nr:single-stranded DNA-binding protein [Alkalihalobacillus alcalophilus]KGA95729.1 single-stranded DNA-binding protein [Alkalihalobacillus alcalophilus ATCC 27647 = CGMCC 1.3604]MED1562362.1 single-stranded DNA-binding protein [Alkalihalobacillus alcalophilus]THG89165.1 single-stranded DNA-binding protein [Alkalihalobacillus alcalophilus ATCC 27647 = CGMCC 1.3604]
MLNRVVLVGRLTRDPELRYTPNGVAVANFTLAVNRTFSNQQGERDADFINCVIWRKPAENVANYLKKGSLAGVDGRIQTRSYDNNEGRRVFITEVVADSVQFLEPRGANQGGQGQSQGNNDFYGAPAGGGNDYAKQGNQQSNRQSGGFNDDPFANDGKPIDISDDDLPF